MHAKPAGNGFAPRQTHRPPHPPAYAPLYVSYTHSSCPCHVLLYWLLLLAFIPCPMMPLRPLALSAVPALRLMPIPYYVPCLLPFLHLSCRSSCLCKFLLKLPPPAPGLAEPLPHSLFYCVCNPCVLPPSLPCLALHFTCSSWPLGRVASVPGSMCLPLPF